MKVVFLTLAVSAGMAFSVPALSSTPEDQVIREIVQGVYIERDYNMPLGREVRTTYRIAHSNGNLIIVAGDRALPGVELYSVSPSERVVNFWIEEEGERGLATMEKLGAIGVLRLTMPSGERHSMDHVRQMTEHDYRVWFRAVIRDHVDASLLNEYERLVLDEGLTMDEAYAQLEGATGPSFDCGGELSGVEQLICHSEELSALDVEMSHLYQRAIQEGYAEEQASLAAEQVAWLGERNQCPSANCLREAYHDRLDDLDEFLHLVTRTPGGMRMD